MTKFEKRILTLRSHLAGAGYHHALRAMGMAQKHHSGVRKDGETPEFDHQVSIALFALTLPHLMHREEVIATIMLHDISEDYGVSKGEIEALFSDRDFGKRVAEAVFAMTKVFRGEKRDATELFLAMSKNPIASIAKGVDRMHNLQSMIGVFTKEKQREYCDEVDVYFLPMLKTARRLFPEQMMAYENIKHILVSQTQLLRSAL